MISVAIAKVGWWYSMAHLILALEPNPQIRRQFLGNVSDLLSAETARKVNSVEIGELAIAWSAGPHAPVDYSQEYGEFALLLGYALAGGTQSVSAEFLREQKQQNEWPREAYDGYFAAVRYSPTAGLTIDVDPLGFFPMFVASQSRSVLVGTSGALFEAHPEFQTELDPTGLAGVLLTNGSIGNRTLLRGVQQLAAGHQLRVTSAGKLAEVETSKIGTPDVDESRSYEKSVDFVQAEFKSALTRHRPAHADTTVLLSGGLDSRLVAAHLKGLGFEFTATTLGKSTDFEVRGARQVAAALNVRWMQKDTECPPDELIQRSRHVARWEHLTSGFSGIQTINPSFGDMAPLFWSGHFLDDILGGYASRYSLDPQTGQMSFETFFGKLNRWGLAPQTLQKLMRPAFSNSQSVVDGLVEELRAEWDRFGGTNAQKSFRLKLATRCRYHLAGAVNRMTNVSWPIAPYLDQRLLRSLLQVSPEAFRGRRLETDLLRMQSSHLLRLPLDTNSFRFENLATVQISSALDPRKLWRSLKKSARSWYWSRYRQLEPRRYQRIFNPDQPDWKTIRAAAEPNRQFLLDWMDRDVLAEIVPAPETNLSLTDPFAGGGAIRSLCGLMLCEAGMRSRTRSAA